MLLQRAPDEESSLQKILEEEEFREYLIKQDRDKLEKQHAEWESTKKKHKTFMSSLKPLRAKVAEQQKELVEGMRSEERQRGPVGYDGCDMEVWTQELVNHWVPPNAHMHRDEFNARWRVRWMFGTVSRSWGTHGYVGSALACLRIAWESHTKYTDLVCDVPGIFPVTVDGVPLAAGAAPPNELQARGNTEPSAFVQAGVGQRPARRTRQTKAKAKAASEPAAPPQQRGRGRGRGCAQSAAPVQSASVPVALAVPAPKAEVRPRRPPSSSSDGSSSTSDSSSS